MTPNGRFVIFWSNATNLVPGDTNGEYDVFLRDRRLGTTIRVSVDSSGAQANGRSDPVGLSDDGRYVAFNSLATNLVAGDTNGARDAFVRDLATGQTTRVGVGPQGGQANDDTGAVALSADGRYVCLQSKATNLVGAQTNGSYQVFVRDCVTGRTVLVSKSSQGDAGNDNTDYVAMSADTRFVAFESRASNLVPNDTNGAADVFLHDRMTGVTTRVSVDSSGAQTVNGMSGGLGPGPAVSDDGLIVAFECMASDLVPSDTNGYFDVFVRDAVAGITTRVSVSSSGAQADHESRLGSMSHDGRYIAFRSEAANLITPTKPNHNRDVYVHDRQTGTTTRISVDASGNHGDAFEYGNYVRRITTDGAYVAFDSTASTLVPGDTNNATDIFVTPR